MEAWSPTHLGNMAEAFLMISREQKRSQESSLGQLHRPSPLL